MCGVQGMYEEELENEEQEEGLYDDDYTAGNAEEEYEKLEEVSSTLDKTPKKRRPNCDILERNP